MVFAWGDGGEGTEFPYEMRLVEIFELACDLGPAHGPGLIDMAQHSAESPDTMEELRCKPDVFAEKLDESRVAQPNLLLHAAYRTCATLTR